MALRHQATSTEPVKLVNGKSSSRICKGEFTIENGRRLSGIRLSHSEVRTSLSMPGGKIKAGSSTHQTKLHMADGKTEDIRKGSSKEDSMDRESEGLKSHNLEADVLLQWGQRKRQRNGRLEAKAAAAEESFTVSKKSMKIMRRSTVIEKHDRSMPVQPARPGRGHVPRPSNPAVRDLRNVDACSLSGSANHVSNGLHLPAEKAQFRDSPLSPEKPDIAVNCNGTTASGGSFAQGGADGEANQGEPPIFEKVDLESFEWPKFVIPLSRKEKEDDFLAVKGSKLPQRPKKRPKHIEKALQYVSPGMWLPDLTRERYEVREKKAVKKRPRGLKAMGSVDSDSE
ncbi:hypothetical protein O6H91_01G131900 [Diphasiastrum complanatum]|uniref:Uncharacterized protein n=1 Tax=Diphasiastrum complanatum TaxID=34168 RepID=A0ACC2EW35_DIPCM|nr:hypothetical protein O6H91_01G131900 [Diphasiastrum complanatum]